VQSALFDCKVELQGSPANGSRILFLPLLCSKFSIIPPKPILPKNSLMILHSKTLVAKFGAYHRMGDVAREEKDFETKRQGLISFRARYSKQMSHTSLGRVEMIIFSMQDLLEEIRTCNFNIKTRLTSSVFVPSILFNFAEFQALLSLRHHPLASALPGSKETPNL